ncbi:hypothetical protein PQO03_11555 [Lentisphaera profundi]|uniref:HMA domain-containing protein n=1 Tax=Lentisphaera profundi TaxID=1658616 RepID=A0ABY7VQ86_9BACT|nr:hypothetical protein [Lentisphaera profundi]WDE96345.1 hypothetical protein PQO03_11555 [Lentisphaera profundi]
MKNLIRLILSVIFVNSLTSDEQKKCQFHEVLLMKNMYKERYNGDNVELIAEQVLTEEIYDYFIPKKYLKSNPHSKYFMYETTPPGLECKTCTKNIKTIIDQYAKKKICITHDTKMKKQKFYHYESSLNVHYVFDPKRNKYPNLSPVGQYFKGPLSEEQKKNPHCKKIEFFICETCDKEYIKEIKK